MTDQASSEVIQNTDTKSTTASFEECVRQANTYNPEWTTNTELRERQSRILNELPSLDVLAEKLALHFLDSKAQDEKYAKLNHRKVRPSNLEKNIRGELLEVLVGAENHLYFSKERPNLNVEHTDRWADPEMEDAITDILKSPPFDSMTRFNRPDISYIEAREGNLIVITGTGEVKATDYLDYHAYKQLRADGVRRILEGLALEVNSISQEEASSRGLKGLGKGGMRLAILQKFTENVYLCRDVKIDNPRKLIKQLDSNGDNAFSEEEYDEFCSILDGTHPVSKVVLRNASFSEKELDRMLGTVLPLVESALTKKQT